MSDCLCCEGLLLFGPWDPTYRPVFPAGWGLDGTLWVSSLLLYACVSCARLRRECGCSDNKPDFLESASSWQSDSSLMVQRLNNGAFTPPLLIPWFIELQERGALLLINISCGYVQLTKWNVTSKDGLQPKSPDFQSWMDLLRAQFKAPRWAPYLFHADVFCLCCQF